MQQQIVFSWHCDCRNGYIDGQDKKTNLRNIFDDSIIARILDYYGEVKILIII